MLKVIERVDESALTCRLCGQRSWVGHTTYTIEGGIFSACNATPVPVCAVCMSAARVRALVWRDHALDMLTFKKRPLSTVDHRAGVFEYTLAPFVGVALYGLSPDQMRYVLTTWTLQRRRAAKANRRRRKGPDGGGPENELKPSKSKLPKAV